MIEVVTQESVNIGNSIHQGFFNVGGREEKGMKREMAAMEKSWGQKFHFQESAPMVGSTASIHSKTIIKTRE